VGFSRVPTVLLPFLLSFGATVSGFHHRIVLRLTPRFLSGPPPMHPPELPNEKGKNILSASIPCRVFLPCCKYSPLPAVINFLMPLSSGDSFLRCCCPCICCQPFPVHFPSLLCENAFYSIHVPRPLFLPPFFGVTRFPI